MKIFSKFLKTNDYLNFLEKLVEQHFSESAKNTFFCDVTKVENFDKKCLTLSKKNKKSPFKHICFGRSKSPVKGLSTLVAAFDKKDTKNPKTRTIRRLLGQEGEETMLLWVPSHATWGSRGTKRRTTRLEKHSAKPR
jgi:hypothetical protein